MSTFDPVAPQVFEMAQGGRWDTAAVSAPLPADVESAAKTLGLHLQVSIGGDGGLVLSASDLALETVLETNRNGNLTVREAMQLQHVVDGEKLRCQTPFRASTSYAAFLALGKTDKRPFVHDSGTGISHWLNDDDWAKLCFDAKSRSDCVPVPVALSSHGAGNFHGDVDALFSDVVLREQDVKKMVDAEFLIPNLIVRGHVGAYVAPGNGGKTTLFIYLCERLTAMGMKVLYINVDGSPGDLKRHHEHALKHGYQIIAPDARDGKSTADVLQKLRAIAEGQFPCDEYVFILDTLKKFVDVIDKRQAKEFNKLMRTLTLKGVTICLLGHCNKYKDDNGNPIYEGTADLRNDSDDLIYLDSCMNEATGCLEITTRPDKVRAEFAPISFVIDLKNDREVREQAAVINIISKEERELIDLIKAAIREGNHSQKDIIAWVKDKTTAGDKKIRERLVKHAQVQNPEFVVKKTGRGKDLEYSLSDAMLTFQAATEGK
jgi:hypothetical protein